MDAQGNELSAIEWKKLYIHLEEKMHQFRVRAINVRAKLAVKMAEMDAKVAAAEEKAKSAETELSVFYSNIRGNSNLEKQETEILRKKIVSLEKRCSVQQKRIDVLEKELEQEALTRNIEKQTLHNKTIKIKDWVQRALRKAERKQHDLQVTNARLNAAIKSMQERLTNVLDSQSVTERRVPERSVVVEEETDISIKSKQLTGATKDSTCISIKSSSFNLVSPFLGTDFYNQDPCYDLQKIGNAHVITEQNSQFETPIISQSPCDLALDVNSRISETKSDGGTELMLSEKTSRPSDDGLKSSTLPLSSNSSNKSNSNNSNSMQTHYNIMGTFDSIRKKFRDLTDYQKSKTVENPTGFPQSREKRIKSKQKFTERSRTNLKSKKFSLSSSRKNNNTVPSKCDSSKSNLPTNNLMVVDLSSSRFYATENETRDIPPTPPLHRMTTMESRIYELTEKGFRISNSFARKCTKSNLPNIDLAIGKYEEIVYKKRPFTIPVFAKVDNTTTVQICSTAFSDASDSSDEDTPCPPALSPPRPSVWHQQRVASTSNELLGQANRRNGSPAIGRAMKRGNSQQSIASSESDYAIPPDAQCIHDLTDLSEPGHKLIKTSKQNSMSLASRIPSSPTRRNDSLLQKCGYLCKLCGKTRTWAKRWVSLKQNTLQIFKSHNDLMKKAQGEIPISNHSTTLARDSPLSKTFQLKYQKHCYFFLAESSLSVTEWIKALQVAGARSSCDWVTRTIGGSSARTWMVFLENENQINFYEDECSQTLDCDKHVKVSCLTLIFNLLKTIKRRFCYAYLQFPFESLNLKKCTVEETRLNLHSTSVSGHSPYATTATDDHVLVIHLHGNMNQNLYLSFESDKVKFSWLQLLLSSTLSPNSSPSNTEICASEFEKLVTKLTQTSSSSNYDVGNESVWRHPLLTYSKQGVARPLTSLSSEPLKTEAMKLAKCIQRFANESLRAEAADYHVSLAQSIAQSCVAHVELRNEVYCQLIKETNRKETEKSRDASSPLLQLWKLLCLLIPIFLPQNEIGIFLSKHLKRNADARSIIGQHAYYCTRALKRTSVMGGRETLPSRTESLVVFFQNPHQHSLPFSIPVHFSDGSYEVISFDCSTTVQEFTRQVAVKSGLQSNFSSGFALFVDNPDVNNTMEHYIHNDVKICDVISIWETVVRHDIAIHKASGHSQDVVSEIGKSPKFFFKRRLPARKFFSKENEKECSLMLHQIALAIMRDMVPISRELAIEMTSLTIQSIYGDRTKNTKLNLNQIICKYFPIRYQGKNFLRNIRERILNSWELLEGLHSSECAKIFLNVARKSPLCFAKVFQAQDRNTKHDKNDIVWLSIGDNGLCILDHSTMEIIETIDYTQLATFGGCKDDLLLVILSPGGSRKLFFRMYKAEFKKLYCASSFEFIKEGKAHRICGLLFTGLLADIHSCTKLTISLHVCYQTGPF